MGAPFGLVLDAEERRLLDKGVDEFNRGFFFECHDTLEELWSGLRGEGRGFVQGLIQVAVAFYHLGNANPAGAKSLLRRALSRFARYPSPYSGFDLDAHRAELTRWLARIEAGDPGGATLGTPPKWTFQ